MEANDVLNSKYLRIEGNKIIYDEMFMIIDELTFKIKNVYTSKANITLSLNDSKFTPITIQRKQAELLKAENSHRVSFKDKVTAYHNLSQNLFVFDEGVDKFVKDAYNLVG